MSWPRVQTGRDLADDAQTSFPNLVLSPIQVPVELLRIVFPTVSQQVGDHKDVARKEQPVHECWTMILATCVVVGVSRCLDTPTWEVSAILQRPPLFLGCKLTLHQLLVVRILEVLR